MNGSTGKYVSAHVYYHAPDLREMILGCIEPLIGSLLDRQLVRNYFFIRYWEGGLHVRLRILPSELGREELVQSIVTERIEEFLRRQPSLIEPDPRLVMNMMRHMYVAEFGEDALLTRYGADAVFPLLPNNSYGLEVYSPEILRYGGSSGVALSEEHFCKSTEIVFKCLKLPNIYRRSTMLGVSLRLMLALLMGYFQNEEHVLMVLHRFARLFRAKTASLGSSQMLQVYEAQAGSLRPIIEKDISVALETDIDSGSPVLDVYKDMAVHGRFLRNQIEHLFCEGLLDFGTADLTLDEASTRLLVSYLHMTNNRLGVILGEEVYLAELLVYSLEARRSRRA